MACLRPDRTARASTTAASKINRTSCWYRQPTTCSGWRTARNASSIRCWALNKAYSLCSTLDQARTYHKEVAFLSAVKAAITATPRGQEADREEKNSVLKQILDNAVVAEGVTDVFALCGLDKPNIGLLSDEFLDDVRRMPYRNLAVELLEKLLKDNIKARTGNNVVQEKRR